MKPLILGVALAALAVFAATGCGGETTTIIERTVTQPSPITAPLTRPALLKEPPLEGWKIEPTTCSFAVDGALAGHDLTWNAWGSPTTIGTGLIWERVQDGQVNDYEKYRGTIVASDPERCDGRFFYTEVVANVPADSIYGRLDPVKLDTPCSGGAPFDGSAVTTRHDEEERERQEAEEAATADATLQHCGRPPNWSGSLDAYGISCDEATLRFEAIHCDSDVCNRRHSGDWPCSIERVGRSTTKGICQKGDRFIRYTVHG